MTSTAADPDTRTLARRLIPPVSLLLCLIASGLGATPWLRAFPANLIAVPLFGAAALSVLIPVVAVRAGLHRLWASVLIDAVCFVVYTLLIVLENPGGFDDLASGLYHGPSQILTFALPLVSPRSLMVAPVALCWLAGAVAGECVARRWTTLLPYAGFLIAYGLCYAASVRAAGGGDRIKETIIAAALLATLLLMRAVREWLEQDASAESTQPDGVLPMRGLVAGGVVALLVAGAAGAAVQSSVFNSATITPQRVPSIQDTRPVTPVAFIAGLRPSGADRTGKPVFTVTTNRTAPGYFAVANVDYYDGDGWSFKRTFRPSGGVLPDDPDAALGKNATAVEQTYEIARGALSRAPWMPYLYRPQRVTGVPVNIDPESGMVVPTHELGAQSYQVRSMVATKTFESVAGSASPDATTPVIDTQLPPTLRTTLATLITTFSAETGTPSTSPISFLQALQRDLRTNYALTGGPTPATSPSAGSTGSTGSATPSPTTTPVSQSPSPGATRAASTGFADVLASIVGPQRAGSPEQYATLVALVARQLGVPARVVTGFRVEANGKTSLPAGDYTVTTADAWTWVEIPVVGAGWVVLDAAPGHYGGQRPQPSVGVTTSSVPTLSPTQNALITEGKGGHAVAKKSTVGSASAPSTLRLLVIVLIAVGLLVLLIALIILGRKPLRARRRRSSPDPRERLVGAWQESLDVLTESGLPDLTSYTSAEVTDATGTRFGPEPAQHTDYLGRSANAAVFSTAPVALADADAAWEAERVLRKSVRDQLGAGGRLMATLRYHRTRPAGPVEAPASWQESARTAPRRRRWWQPRRRSH